MGDLVKGYCIPVCQESCIANTVVRDLNCVATSCRVGCACPKDRPLRKGLRCIRRSECGVTAVQNNLTPTTARTTTRAVSLNGGNSETDLAAKKGNLDYKEYYLHVVCIKSKIKLKSFRILKCMFSKLQSITNNKFEILRF